MATQDALRNPWASGAHVGSVRRRFDTPRHTAHWFQGRSLARPWIRPILRVILIAMLVTVAFEFSLRTFEALNGAPLAILDPIADFKHQPGASSGSGINQLGYRDDEFRPRLVVDRYRVAVLGNESLLTPNDQPGCLAHLEQRLSDVEVYNFALPGAGPQEFVHQAASELLRFRPDVVLVFLTVGEELTSCDESLFDWRIVRVASHALKALSSSTATTSSSMSAEVIPVSTYEQYLNSASRRLSTCRVQATAADQQQWHQSCRHLDNVIAHCRGGMTEVALVVLPADYQVNAALRQTLVRRAGGAAKDYDVDLPQRRLARYAHDQGVALLDLTPALRAKPQSVFAASAGHLNAEGMQIVAQTLADWLQSRYGDEIRSMSGDALTQHP